MLFEEIQKNFTDSLCNIMCCRKMQKITDKELIKHIELLDAKICELCGCIHKEDETCFNCGYDEFTFNEEGLIISAEWDCIDGHNVLHIDKYKDKLVDDICNDNGLYYASRYNKTVIILQRSLQTDEFENRIVLYKEKDNTNIKNIDEKTQDIINKICEILNFKIY